MSGENKQGFLSNITELKGIIAVALVLVTALTFFLRPILKGLYKSTKSKTALYWGAKYFSLFPSEYSKNSPESQFLKYALSTGNGNGASSTKGLVKELRKADPTDLKLPSLPPKTVVESMRIGRVKTLKIVADPNDRNNNVVGVYCHGGSYVSGCAEGSAEFAHELSKRLKMPIYVPNVRLLPENTLQDVLDDMKDVLKGIGRNKMYVLGGSGSGANLALRATREAQKVNLRMPSALFSISGALDGAYTLEPAGPKESALVKIYQESYEEVAEMKEELEVYKYDFADFPFVWQCWDKDEQFNFEANRTTASRLEEAGVKHHCEETEGLFENAPAHFTENIPESVGLLDSLTKHLTQGQALKK